jgi:Fur family transcriptional regulator, ferric uptake regulator
MIKRRNTVARQAILSMLQTADTALSQDMIEQRLQGVADRVTIYRVLNSFCADGIAHSVVSDEGKTYFAACTGCKEQHTHDHLHFRCLKCQRVECLGDQTRVVLPQGYQAVNINCWVSGYCIACGRS